MSTYLFLLFITLSQPMPDSHAQAIKQYTGDAAGMAACQADGAALWPILNTPLHVTSLQMVIYTCVQFRTIPANTIGP